MTDVPYPDDMDRVVELDQSEIENLPVGVASNIDYAFEFHWRPRWVKGGEAHCWTKAFDSGDEQHFVECLRCKSITVHANATDGDAWYSQHICEHA